MSTCFDSSICNVHLDTGMIFNQVWSKLKISFGGTLYLVTVSVIMLKVIWQFSVSYCIFALEVTKSSLEEYNPVLVICIGPPASMRSEGFLCLTNSRAVTMPHAWCCICGAPTCLSKSPKSSGLPHFFGINALTDWCSFDCTIYFFVKARIALFVMSNWRSLLNLLTAATLPCSMVYFAILAWVSGV